MITQGTTPTHTFKLSCSTNLIKDVMITYIQDKEVIFTKTLVDAKQNDRNLIIELTQQETMSFSPLLNVRIEFKVLMQNNKVTTKIFKNIPVEEVINKEVFPI